MRRFEDMEYFIVMLRIVTVIMLFLAVALIMGKRHIGELSVFDFIIAITLGSVAGADLADPQVPHGPTIVAIIALGLIHLLLSRTILKNRKAAHLITLDPTIVVQNGVILKDNLSRIRYTVDELLSHLREKDVFDLKEVEFAVLEPSGVLSVLKKSQYLSATPHDLGLPTVYKGLSYPVIMEGSINKEVLNTLHLSEEWLLGKLKDLNYENPEAIFLGMLNTTGELYLSPRLSPLSPQQLDN